MKPYCFVLMPFGRKSDESGRVVEFDSVYELVIKPAIENAELEPIRADEEIIGGIIHKPITRGFMINSRIPAALAFSSVITSLNPVKRITGISGLM